MAFTQADLDTLDKAIISGAQEVRFADRTIVYRSMKELLATRTLIVNALGQNLVRQVRMETQSGI